MFGDFEDIEHRDQKYCGTDTAGRTVVLTPCEGKPQPNDFLWHGRAFVMPDGYEQVYDICGNQHVLAKKLETPRRILVEFEFTNEHTVRMIENLVRLRGVGMKSILELPPHPANTTPVIFPGGALSMYHAESD